jgi:hypothetical protein
MKRRELLAAKINTNIRVISRATDYAVDTRHRRFRPLAIVYSQVGVLAMLAVQIGEVKIAITAVATV